MTCPNCGDSPIGGYAVDGAICSECRSVYIPEHQYDEMKDRLIRNINTTGEQRTLSDYE